MSFTEFQERLSRSIRVRGLPVGYDKDEVLNNLKNAGTIEDTKLGATEMIVIYSSANEKDLSKMYDGCPIGDYVINLEDPTSFEVDSDQNKPEETPVEPEVIKPAEHSEKPAQDNYQEPKSPEIQHNEPKPEEPVASPQYAEPEPLRPAEEIREPAAVEKTEPAQPEKKPEAPVEKKVEAPVEKKVEAPVEKKVEAPVERKQEAPVERKPEPAAVSQQPGDSAKNLLRDLQNTNLPARAGLPEGDAFKMVTKGSFLLIFTMIWGLQLFLRSVF